LEFIAGDSVCVLWIEDLQEMLTLPSKLQTQAIVFICIYPLAERSSDGLYRIRIIVANNNSSGGAMSPAPSSPPHSATLPNNTDAGYQFGPLLDGMVISRESVGQLVRETIISACLFVQEKLHNQPKALWKRVQFLTQMRAKYRAPHLPAGRYYEDHLFG
jgi:hypothetical protein